jgi:hypothetical protein
MAPFKMKGFSGFKQSSPTKLAGGRYLLTDDPKNPGQMIETQISAEKEARLKDEARKAEAAGNVNYKDPFIIRTGLEEYKEGGKYADLGLNSMDKIHAKYAELAEKYPRQSLGEHVDPEVLKDPDYKLMDQLRKTINYAGSAHGKDEMRKQADLDRRKSGDLE